MKKPSVKTLLGAITAHVMLATLEMDLTALVSTYTSLLSHGIYIASAQILMNVRRCYMTATYLPSASTFLVSTTAVVLKPLKEMGHIAVSYRIAT